MQAGTGQNQVLLRWASAREAGPVNSDAAAIRVLLQAGVESFSDDVLDEGYAELAPFYERATEDDERRTARERYVARTEAVL